MKRKDEETGLHYNRYRYYEPHSGRYISKDPIGLDGSLNSLMYVGNPNHWVDHLGLYDLSGLGGAGLDQKISCYQNFGQEFCDTKIITLPLVTLCPSNFKSNEDKAISAGGFVIHSVKDLCLKAMPDYAVCSFGGEARLVQ